MDPTIFVQQFLNSEGRRREWQYFAYSTAPILNIAASGNGQDDIAIQSDSDFLAFDLEVTVTTNAAPQTVIEFPSVTLQVFDTGSGRNFFNAATHVNNVAGNAQRPGAMWPYRHCRGGGSLQVTVTNLNAGAAIDAYVTVRGIKVFPAGTI